MKTKVHTDGFDGWGSGQEREPKRWTRGASSLLEGNHFESAAEMVRC